MPRKWIMALALTAASPMGSSALACAIHLPLEIEDVGNADVIVIGHIARYENLGDYAYFEIQVDQFLKGSSARKIKVAWQNSTFGQPAGLASGPYLIALRDPASSAQPSRDPSGTSFEVGVPGLPTVLQRSCSDAFILPTGGTSALQVRGLFEKLG